MNESITFLTGGEIGWEAVKDSLKAVMAQGGFDKLAIDWMCDDFRPRFNALSREIATSLPIEHSYEARRVVDEARYLALLQMFQLEIELYRAKFGLPPDGLNMGIAVPLAA